MRKIIYFLFILLPAGAFAQGMVSGRVLNQADRKPVPDAPVSRIADTLKTKLLSLKAKSDSLGIKLIPEKLYLQFDKPYYAAGDTIWFKAYLLNNFLTPSVKSGILNVDIANDSNKVVRQYRFPVQSGLAWGNIALDEKYFFSGNYTIRAYTNWMRNFGDDCFFYKTFTVSNANGAQLLVNSSLNITAKDDSAVVAGQIRLTNTDKIPFAGQPLTLRITANDKPLSHAKVTTGVDGVVALNFKLAQKTNKPAIVIENDKHDRLAVMPVTLNRPQNADVQFLPEGGSLVAGLPARVGFKAIGEDGRSTSVTGVILNNDQKQVAQFKSLHNGMGSFNLDVQPGGHYTAQVTLPGGIVKQYPLPSVQNNGTCLSVSNEIGSDSLAVTVAASPGIAQSGNSFFLVGRARGIVCYGAIVNFSGGAIRRKIAKGLFPAGIAHFTLMTTKYQALNERLVFIDRHDGLTVKVTSDKPFYNGRDSVALKLKVTDADGGPVATDLSVAVTDNAQVKAGGVGDENIETRFLLTSNLKGYVEQPGYYLSLKTPEAWQALDDLLLTQGWVGYKWPDVIDPPAPSFTPETAFNVTGRITNVFNKTLKDTHVLLFSKKPPILIDTLTDSNGRFVFDRLPKVDTPVFVLRAVNKNGKSFNVNLTVDETPPPVFTKPQAPFIMPWYVNADDTLLNYAKKTIAQQQQGFIPNGHLLKEVNIKGRKIIKSSQNLNGPGNADFVMDENDIEAAGKKTWLQLLQENVKGFGEGQFNLMSFINGARERYLNLYVTDFLADFTSPVWYFIHGKPVKIIVDGVEVNQLIALKNFRDLKDYLSHSAEEIKGLEVISSSKFAAAYLSRYNPYDPNSGEDLLTEALEQPKEQINIGSSDIAFVEITTRSGHGPAINSTPGMYLYKPLPFSWPKQFYKPKYNFTDTVNRPDFRSTIDWEPNVVTNAKGEAAISFFTANKASAYTVKIEGADMNGHFVFNRSIVIVGEKEKKAK